MESKEFALAHKPNPLAAKLNATLKFVHSPSFLGIISMVLLLATIPAQAGLLKGYLHTGSTTPDEEATKLHRSMIRDNSFPETFAGLWKCVTVVVDSAVSSVPIGQRVESEVSFVEQKDGRIVARWEQPGWTEAQASVHPMSPREVSLERTNYYMNHGLNGGWAAHSRDRYLQIDANRIAASSHVEQFIDGKFLGQYQTRSMLYRVSEDLALAKPINVGLHEIAPAE